MSGGGPNQELWLFLGDDFVVVWLWEEKGLPKEFSSSFDSYGVFVVLLDGLEGSPWPGIERYGRR